MTTSHLPKNPASKPPCRGRLRLRPGFSLAELLIVLAIIGVLAALALPFLSANVPHQLSAGAQTVASDLEYVQGLAVANNSTYRLTFDIGQNSYTFEHSGANTALDNLPPSPFHESSADGKLQTANLNDLPLMNGGAKLIAVQKNPSSPSSVTDLEFGPNGATTRSEETILWLASDNADQRIFLPITVNATTGIVTVGDVQAATPAGL